MDNVMQEQKTSSWRSTFLQAYRDLGELVHDFGWLAGWITVRVAAAAIEGQALLALRRRLRLPV